MGTRKLDLRSAPPNLNKTVNKVFKAAFGPSPALYRQISLCGWRTLIDLRNNGTLEENDTTKRILGSSPKSSGIEVYETAEGLTVEVALTCVNEESLHLAIAGKMLIIRGERLDGSRHNCSLTTAKELPPRFQHYIQIPTSVNAGCFRAQLKGDVVQIEFARRR